MPPCNCHPPFPRPEPFSPLPRPGKIPDWGKWIRDRLAEKGALLVFPTRASFPGAGEWPNLYLDLETGAVYRWDREDYAVLVDPREGNDVLVYDSVAAFPDEGEQGKLYIAANTGALYRWGGEGYVALLEGKADKVSGATEGNFAGLDGSGNPTDSGKKPSDFATAAQGAKADTAVQPAALTGFVDGAEYDAEYGDPPKPAILLKHGATVVATVDATDFVIDGMVSDVKIENGNLVITFNTDSGKQPISIPLTDIFDPANYYDKDTADSTFLKIRASQISIGDGTKTVAQGATNYIDIGRDTTIRGSGTMALGNSATAGGDNAMAIGPNANVQTDNAMALGSNTTASGTQALAIGNGANASAYGQAEGLSATAATDGTAVGFQAHANSSGVAIGAHAEISGGESIAIGHNAFATASNAGQIGPGTNNTADTLKYRYYRVVGPNGDVAPAKRHKTDLTVYDFANAVASFPDGFSCTWSSGSGTVVTYEAPSGGEQITFVGPVAGIYNYNYWYPSDALSGYTPSSGWCLCAPDHGVVPATMMYKTSITYRIYGGDSGLPELAISDGSESGGHPTLSRPINSTADTLAKKSELAGKLDASNGVATGLVVAFANYGIRWGSRSSTEYTLELVYRPNASSSWAAIRTFYIPQATTGNLALIEQVVSKAIEAIAPEFSILYSYKVGQLVRKDGILYICTTAHPIATPWDPSHFSANATVESALAVIRAAIPVASTDTPNPDGTGSAGSASFGFSCGNHVHPSDSTKLDKSGPSNRKIQWNEGSGRLDVVDESGGHLQFPKNSYSSGEIVASQEFVRATCPTKASPATAGNLASLTQDGGIEDAGWKAGDLARYALTTKSITNNAVSLDDRAMNAVAVSSSLASLTVNFPTATSGKARDFGLRLTVASGVTTAPQIVLPQGVTCENADGEAPEIGADGAATILYFTETASGVFLVKGEVLQTITQA